MLWGDSFDGWLRCGNDRFAIVLHDALKPNIIIEDAVLEEETVEILGWSCSVGVRAEGNAVSLVSILPSRLEIPLGTLLKKDIVLTTLSKHGRQPSARAYFPVFFGPLDETPLLCFNTACATEVIGIVVWSWRTASTREVSG